jgi:RNA polymerase sigma-B factor
MIDADELTRVVSEHRTLLLADVRRPLLRLRVVELATPLLTRLARRYALRPAEIEDLTQTGQLALLGALDRWDPELANGKDFIAFLVPTVRGAMLHHYRDHAWAVRYPRSVKELAARVAKESETLGQELGRAPRPAEIASALGVELDAVVDALHMQFTHDVTSLDGAGDGGPALAEKLGTDDRALADVDDRDAVARLVAELAPRDRLILELRFRDELSQREIATRVGLSQMQVSRILAATLERLRRLALA